MKKTKKSFKWRGRENKQKIGPVRSNQQNKVSTKGTEGGRAAVMNGGVTAVP